MKIQPRILLTIILTLIISTITSIFLIIFIINIFDKSFSRYDVEKYITQIIIELHNLKKFDKRDIDKIIYKYKTDKIDIALIDKKNHKVLASTIADLNINKMIFIKKRFDNIKKMENSITRQNKFIDVFDNKDHVIGRPINIKNSTEADLFVIIKKELFPPFSIHINQDKIIFIYILLFISLASILLFSFILMLLFTMPLIKRLSLLFNKINNFELDKPNIKINDNHNDEIGTISNTFDIMVNKINQDYNEKMKFFKERQELIRNISHDFRTPLTSILGYSISLDEDMYENENEQKKYYKIIRKKAEYMSELFDELMELSRLDNNAFILKKIDFDIAEMLREIIIEYIPQLEKENFFIKSAIPESLVIHADKERLSRAIRNIIENVIKHGKDGKYIGLFINTDKKNITIKIKDKGKGIDTNKTDKIFQRFYKNSPASGMGLGLSIAKEVIEKHNGKINVDTIKNKGVTFTIVLPH